MTEAVNHTSVRDVWLQPFVDSCAGGVVVAARNVCVSWEGEVLLVFYNTPRYPKRHANQWDVALTSPCLELTPRVFAKTNVGDVGIDLNVRCQQSCSFSQAHTCVTDQRHQPPDIIIQFNALLLDGHKVPLRNR